MEFLNNLLNTPVGADKVLGDFLTIGFMASILGSVVTAILILIAGYIVAGWVKRRIVAIAENNPKLDDTLFHFLGNIVRWIILGFAFLIILNTFGVQTTSIIAAIGAAGLAVGLALQGTLSNVAGGVMIIVFRPFKMGDFVEIDGQMGTVKDITLNTTELADLSNVQVIVPNSDVWGNTIKNYSTNKTRRAEWTFGVGYGVNLAKAEQVIRDTIMADERSKTEPEPFFQVTNLGDSSVDFLVRVWVDASEYFAYKADITRKVKEALDEADIEIPFPCRTIYTVAAE
ncbi:mechanosensitive ion channel family protein [Vannielia litorea]|uniref:mechanosensitive ion channel family protein n=1 Tax=Vannielia litorea TaxID=1217970 RepID=UPI001C96F523|nr:mechanosensitive ion channel family protein [Vannielia litorea]MBY6155459.1 mechanosensitive ion channel family protein [Vannielia litorea]